MRTCYQKHMMQTCHCAAGQFPRVARAYGNMTADVCDDADDEQSKFTRYMSNN